MFVFVIIYVISIIGFIIHFYSLPQEERTKERGVEIFLLYQLIFSMGLTSLISFIGLTWMDVMVAKKLAWPTCPFQQNLANVNLAYGILGIIAIWYRGYFWLATIIGFAIWILTDAVHHIYDAYAHSNFSEGNVGFLLYTDIFVPIILCIACYYYFKLKKTY